MDSRRRVRAGPRPSATASYSARCSCASPTTARSNTRTRRGHEHNASRCGRGVNSDNVIHIFVTRTRLYTALKLNDNNMTRSFRRKNHHLRNGYIKPIQYVYMCVYVCIYSFWLHSDTYTVVHAVRFY
jgi:hypothetical protein